MTTRAALRATLLFAFAAAATAVTACGRNGLDLGEDPGDAGAADARVDSGPVLACGSATCSLPAQYCCVGSGTQASAHQCLAVSGAPTCLGARVSCRDDSVCATGEACCLSTNATGTVCMPRGQCVATSATVRFCASAADCLPDNPVCCPLQISQTGYCTSLDFGCLSGSGASP